jgi:hypothetical protein
VIDASVTTFPAAIELGAIANCLSLDEGEEVLVDLVLMWWSPTVLIDADAIGDRCRSGASLQQRQKHEQQPRSAHDSTDWITDFRHAHLAPEECVLKAKDQRGVRAYPGAA